MTPQPKQPEVIYASRRPAMTQAKRRQTRTGRPHYVVRGATGCYAITDRMPLLGMWWTTDGMRHG